MSTSLLRTTPQGELKAIQGLTRKGHSAWTPTEDRVKRAYRHGKKKRTITVPLAPRYVIAQFADQPDGECTKCRGSGSVLKDVSPAQDLALARAEKPIPRTRCRRCDGTGQVAGRTGGVPWQDLTDINEISGMVGSLREPDVARLKAMDGAKAETIIAKSLAVGQRVTVVSGPLRDHHSVIEAIAGPDAIVKIDILGKQTPVTMPLAFLDPL